MGRDFLTLFTIRKSAIMTLFREWWLWPRNFASEAPVLWKAKLAVV